MTTEHSCGGVVFKRESGRFIFVIIQSKEGIFGFPKGHIEQTETERETALREILEETGLRVELLDGFRTEDSHLFYREGQPIMKHIVYFLGEFSNQTPVVQESELNSIHLMDYESAMSAFQFESSKRILTEAFNYLTLQHLVL